MLPDWIDLPAPRPFAEIRFAPAQNDSSRGVFFAWDGTSVVSATFEFYELYDELDRNYNIEISPTAQGAAGLSEMFPRQMYSQPSGKDGTVRAIITLSDMDHWDFLQRDYHEAAAAILGYRKNPNIDTAFAMLNYHPAFWTKNSAEPSFTWNNEQLVDNFSYFRVDGEWCIEAGGHTDDLTDHYLDYELTTYGKTFEECIIGLAEKVDAKFNIDGTKREA